MSIPRPEHPKPQFFRDTWHNLNGTWQFEIDNGRSGVERNLMAVGAQLSGEITVPFCPESRLSGLAHTDFMYGVWYKRTVDIADISGRVLLHFGAVDYCATVFVNGETAGTHKGGYVSFCLDITAFVHSGSNEIAVFAEDDTRDRLKPTGKQSERYNSFDCFYTRTTGIWQTVWLEFVPEAYVKSACFTAEASLAGVDFQLELEGCGPLSLEASYDGRVVGEYSLTCAAGVVNGQLSVSESHLWEPGHGRLYDVTIRFGADTVKSYFGLRTIRFDGHRFLLNGKSVFQRLVLDQGFYPDGIYTAPTDEALRNDILLSMQAGFNGARLHEKIFEERFLYHADALGYLVWGEFPNWGLDISYADSIYGMLPEWIEELKRDYSHPAVVGWCPFNETWDQNGRKQFDPVLDTVYHVTKAIDPTRPCIDTSGNFHVVTDVFCVHDYDQNPETFKAHYDELMINGTLYERFPDRQAYHGQPCFVSEYGGIGWYEDARGWGYGNAPTTKEEFMRRFAGLTEALLANREMFGLCYTQLTNVEQEQNGLYTYDRKPKFDMDAIRAILSQKAAIED